MTLIAAVRIARLCLGVTLLWGLFYLSVRPLLLDDLRQKLFAIRDDLFDFAVDGAIDFNDRSYRELRSDINSLIRFADKLSFIRLLLAFLAAHDDHPATVAVRQWTERVRGLDPLVRNKLLQARYTALREIIFYIMRRSLILYFLFSLLKLAGLFVHAARSFLQQLPKFAEPLEAQARDELDYAA